MRACIYAKHQAAIDLDFEHKKQKLIELTIYNKWTMFRQLLKLSKESCFLFAKLAETIISYLVIACIAPFAILFFIYSVFIVIWLPINPARFNYYMNETDVVAIVGQKVVKMACYFNNTQSVYLLDVIQDPLTWWPWFLAYVVHFWKYCTMILLNTC